MKRAFTLIEVNLAMLIMAGGILSVVGLYSLGFRENRQSREDVAATALADSVISPLVRALSATNVTWTSFRQLKNYPNNSGWGAYFDSDGLVKTDPTSQADGAFSSVMGAIKFKGTYAGSREYSSVSGMSPALVVLHDDDSAIVRIGFRAVKKDSPNLLMSMPLFYTEVRFQGVPE
jgi:type II secretory pathway pseudopilin PulG